MPERPARQGISPFEHRLPSHPQIPPRPQVPPQPEPLPREEFFSVSVKSWAQMVEVEKNLVEAVNRLEKKQEERASQLGQLKQAFSEMRNDVKADMKQILKRLGGK